MVGQTSETLVLDLFPVSRFGPSMVVQTQHVDANAVLKVGGRGGDFYYCGGGRVGVKDGMNETEDEHKDEYTSGRAMR